MSQYFTRIRECRALNDKLVVELRREQIIGSSPVCSILSAPDDESVARAMNQQFDIARQLGDFP